MKRIDALRVLVDETVDEPIVVTCAATTRELAAFRDRPSHLYLLDSMGLAVSVASGLALAAPSGAHVVAVEGDGSLLMNPGALATLGYLEPAGIVVLILDNGAYASTGGLPTHAVKIDLCALASACGIDHVEVADPGNLTRELRRALASPRPFFIHARIDHQNQAGVPLALFDPTVLADRFQAWLASGWGETAGSDK